MKKKAYQNPKTESIQLIGKNAIMVGSVFIGGGYGNPDGMD